MKLSFSLVAILLLSACTNSVNKSEFVNPIFNQPLISNTGDIYLTPTSIDMRTPKDKNLVAGKGICELTENQLTKITLHCDVKWRQLETYEHAQELLKRKEKWAQLWGKDILKKLSPDYSEDWYFSYTINEHQISDKYIRITEHSWLSEEPEYKSSSHYIIYLPADYKSEPD